MNTRELVEMLNELAERDLAEGADIVDHPAHIAAIKLIELESLQAEKKDWSDYLRNKRINT